MRILLRNKLSPIYLAPSDRIILSYTDESGRKTQVANKTVDRAMIVDEGIVFDLDERELEALGLRDAIGGLFGESKK